MIVLIDNMFNHQVLLVLMLFFCEQYVCSQRILSEGTKLPAPNKRGNEIEKDVPTRKKVKTICDKSYKNVKSHVHFPIFRQKRAWKVILNQ